jgi:hypothetical protein
VSTTADRRTRGRTLGSDRLATQQESRRSRECLFWVLGQSLPKRTQDWRDQQRASPWVEPRTRDEPLPAEGAPARLAPRGNQWTTVSPGRAAVNVPDEPCKQCIAASTRAGAAAHLHDVLTTGRGTATGEP